MSTEQMFFSLPAIIIGLTIHEFAHAFVADRLGDPLPASQGRLTLNPLKHIDPFGFLFLMIAGFGWAKPVPINPSVLQNPRRDKALIAAAGPFSNLILAVITLVILKMFAAPSGGGLGFFGSITYKLLFYTAVINIALFIFNMIPIPPLDGSHILLQWLRLDHNTEYKFMKYGMFILFGILLFSWITGINLLPIGAAIQWIIKLIL